MDSVDVVNNVGCKETKILKCIKVNEFSWEATAPGVFPMQISIGQMTLKLDLKEVRHAIASNTRTCIDYVLLHNGLIHWRTVQGRG